MKQVRTAKIKTSISAEDILPTIQAYFNYQDQVWYQHGLKHREDGPAVVIYGNRQYWYKGTQYPEITSDEEWVNIVKFLVFA